MNKSRKIISVLAALALTLPVMSFAACGEKEFVGDDLSDYVSGKEVTSNGGFVVEQGDFVYFINGKANNTDDNTYGNVVKGALMRVSKSELANGTATPKTVVSSLFVTGNYDSGIYIYGDYVYYATPTTDKNKDGEVQNSYLDFKRAKIDGTEAPMGGKNDYFFRLSSNTTKFRFVEDEKTKVVYCMYEEDGALKSYNTTTGATTVLVSGASSYIYDKEDLTSGNVYYTMSVTLDPDTDAPTTATYNQVYCVNAASTVKVDAEKASYTAINENGKEVASYAFDKSFMEKKNAEAKEAKEDAVYNFSDHATYPYVNLGQLVLDGIGKMGNESDNRFNADVESAAQASEFGFTYTLQQQENGGVYFTRKSLTAAGDTEIPALYYLGSEKTAADDWNTITANDLANGKIDVVSTNTTNASATAVYEYSETAGHTYMYLADNALWKSDKNGDVKMVSNLSGVTLWKTDGNYLYYYGTGTNGNNLSRIDYTGSEENYNEFLSSTIHEPVTLPLMDWHDSWFKPEILSDGSAILYANAQSFGAGATSYNNIYLAKLGTNAEIEAANEEVEAINEYIAEASTNAQSVLKYYFRTGKLDAYTAVKDKYSAKQQEEVTAFEKEFKDGNFKLESAYIQSVGKVNEKEQEAINEAWADFLLKETVTADESGVPDWVIWVIIAGGVVVLAAAAVVILLVVKKKADDKKKAEEEIVSAYKRKKIDTTDDKTIDVYADDVEIVPVEEAPAEETSETDAPVEE